VLLRTEPTRSRATNRAYLGAADESSWLTAAPPWERKTAVAGGTARRSWSRHTTAAAPTRSRQSSASRKRIAAVGHPAAGASDQTFRSNIPD
jgi:hypothetical protein